MARVVGDRPQVAFRKIEDPTSPQGKRTINETLSSTITLLNKLSQEMATVSTTASSVASQVEDNFIPIDGQSLFPLSGKVNSNATIDVFINGVRQPNNGTYFTVATYNSTQDKVTLASAVNSGDQVSIKYSPL